MSRNPRRSFCSDIRNSNQPLQDAYTVRISNKYSGFYEESDEDLKALAEDSTAMFRTSRWVSTSLLRHPHVRKQWKAAENDSVVKNTGDSETAPGAVSDDTDNCTFLPSATTSRGSGANVNLKMVLKNVPACFTSDEVASDLNSQGLETVSVRQLTKQEDSHQDIETLLPIFVVVFVGGITKRDVYARRKVCDSVVQWENLRRNASKAVRCYCCRRRGHIARECARVTERCESESLRNNAFRKTDLSSSSRRSPTDAQVGTENIYTRYGRWGETSRVPYKKQFVKSNKYDLDDNLQFPPLSHRKCNKSQGKSRCSDRSAKSDPVVSEVGSVKQAVELFTEIKGFFKTLNLSRVTNQLESVLTRFRSAPDASTKCVILFCGLAQLFD